MEIMSKIDGASDKSKSIDFIDLNASVEEAKLRKLGSLKGSKALTASSENNVLQSQKSENEEPIVEFGRPLSMSVGETQISESFREQLQTAIGKHSSFLEINDSVAKLTETAVQSITELKQDFQSLNEETQEDRNERVSKQRHENVMCQYCLALTIRGKRYMCLQCPSLNLCAKCESRTNHPHTMLRIVEPIDVQTAKNTISSFSLRHTVDGKETQNLRLSALKSLAGPNRPPAFYRLFLDRYKELDIVHFLEEVKTMFQSNF